MATADLAEKARELFIEDALPEGLGWVECLSPRHMRLFAIELNAALAAPDPDRIAALLDAWRGTAELDAAPDVQETIERNRAGGFAPIDAWLNARRTA